VGVEEVDGAELDRLAAAHGSLRHQGVAALVAPLKCSDVDDILAGARAKGEIPLVIALDRIQDPMNLGSIVRTAEAAGAHGIILPRRRSVGLTPAVARSSAGAVEHLRVARVSNMVSELRSLKEKGLWVAGLDVSGGPLWKADLSRPLVLVVGGEGTGLGRLVRETCDFLVGIPIVGKVGSLNAGVAAALAIYEAVRQRSE
jgi:23S rRNA (guanosine2251-2'-O)-methyltransferase